MSIQQDDSLALLSERVGCLEDGFKMYRSRQDALGKEVKVILAEIHIITEWIHQKFGVELINKNSFLYKHIHDFEEVQEISATLCLLANVAINATKYTGAELAAAAAAAAAGNAAAAAAAAAAANSNQDHQGRGGGYLGRSSTSPVSPSPGRLRASALPPEHPPRPISTPPVIAGQQMYQQHTLLIQQGSPLPAHSASMHHHHSHHPPPLPSPHQLSHHNVHHQQIHLQHIQQAPLTPVTSAQHHQQYILPHSPNSAPSMACAPSKLSPTNLPPPAPLPNSSPNSPTNLSHSQLIISKKCKPNSQQHSSGMISPSPPTTKILPPPPPRLPPPSPSSIPPPVLTLGKNSIPVSVVTLIPPTPSATAQTSMSQPYQTQQHPISSSPMTSSSNSHPPTVHIHHHQQHPPPPSTPTVTHISVPPKKSLSSRNLSHSTNNTTTTTGSGNIKKYFKPLVILQQQQAGTQSCSRPSSPMSLQDHKPNLTTGTLVESHGTIGQVYVFSETNEQQPPIVDISRESNTPFKREPSVELMDTVENRESNEESGIELRPVTPVNTTIPTPDPEVHRPKRRNRKKGYGKSSSARMNANDRGRSPIHNTNSLDYTADTEDEVPSARDTTPVANKRKTHGSPKTVKTSTPITTTPKSSKVHNHTMRSSTPISPTPTPGPSKRISEPPESPIPGPSSAITNLHSGSLSNSSSRHQSGGEESSSTGTSEKLPKRGRPKKRPEERVRTYDPRVPMQCDECGKVLKGTGALRVHKQIHQNIRPYDCTVCGRAFRRKHHLEFHMMIHEGNKKETCSYCGKAFLIRRDLARHERTHTGEKPYSCHLCPKSFNVKQHLTLHIRTHTGERPYRCPICDKTFTQANSLRIHKKIHLRDRERAENAGGTGGGGSTGGNANSGGAKGGKGKGGANSRSNSASSTSANSNASNSSNSSTGSASSSSTTTSGISSASTSTIETPDRIRPPSSGGGGSRVTSPNPSLRSGQSSPPSPAVRQHPLLQHVHIPPPVAETVTVVTSPPAHITGHTFEGVRGEHSFHGTATISTQPSSPPTTWRLSLNPGSGTNLISPPGANRDGRSPPPATFTIPAAHQVQPTAGGNPGHYAVIRNMVPATPSPGPTLVRAYVPSAETHHHEGNGMDTRNTPPSSSANNVPAHHHSQFHHGQSPPNATSSTSGPPTATFTIYDPNVTRYYN